MVQITARRLGKRPASKCWQWWHCCRLIQELDIEVETLDNAGRDGRLALGDRDDLPERASALCLAATLVPPEPPSMVRKVLDRLKLGG